jgi:hypothetical protein
MQFLGILLNYLIKRQLVLSYLLLCCATFSIVLLIFFFIHIYQVQIQTLFFNNILKFYFIRHSLYK